MKLIKMYGRICVCPMVKKKLLINDKNWYMIMVHRTCQRNARKALIMDKVK